MYRSIDSSLSCALLFFLILSLALAFRIAHHCSQATLTHSMYFHMPVRADEWLLYRIKVLRNGGSRSLCLGEFYNEAGECVVTCTQEGLFRYKDDTWKKKKEAAAAAAAAGGAIRSSL
jgi:acyl-CoA thioesterase